MLEDVHGELGLHPHGFAEPPTILAIGGARKHEHIRCHWKTWEEALSLLSDVSLHLVDVDWWRRTLRCGIFCNLAIAPVAIWCQGRIKSKKSAKNTCMGLTIPPNKKRCGAMALPTCRGILDCHLCGPMRGHNTLLPCSTIHHVRQACKSGLCQRGSCHQDRRFARHPLHR